MIRFGSILFLLLAAACASQPQPPPKAVTAGDLLARAQCPERIAEAAAWVTHAQGAARPPQELIVGARLENPKAVALLFRGADSHDGTLILDIRVSDTARQPGKITYREPAPEKPYNRVVFRCRGGVVFSLETIDNVF
jgi:hypothetical protein